MQKVINKAQELVGEGRQLLYLTRYGSHLYGTNTPESDSDFKGIFLPSFEDLLFGNPPEELRYNTGDDESKNTKDDVDMVIFSLQRFLELVRKGDTNGLDLLYSYTNKDCILYQYDIPMESMGYDYTYPIAEYIADNINNVLDIKTSNAYVGYAIGQAKKYGIKGSRLGVLKKIKEFLQDKHFKARMEGKGKSGFLDKRLSDIEGELLDKYHHESYCFQKKIKDDWYLLICGSCHQYNITIEEFYNRINRECGKYGERSEAALGAGGVDWKALSHAVRVIGQCKQLYSEGKITFPCKDVRSLLKVKKGLMSYDDVEELIITGLDELEMLKQNCKFDYKYDLKFITTFLKSLYSVE